MAFQDRWFGAIRSSALVYITGFECVIVVANMISISPTILEKVAFAGIGIFIVLFKVQARLEGYWKLWLVGACLTFYMFMNFFLAICSIGLPAIAQDKLESETTKQLAYEYEMSVQAYNKLLKNQTEADYTMRTYMKELGGPIADAKKSKEELREKLQSARAQDTEVQARNEQSFNGIRVFETAPRLAISALSFGNGLRPDTRIGIGIAFLFGIAAGLFVEGTMVATANRRRQVILSEAKGQVTEGNEGKVLDATQSRQRFGGINGSNSGLDSVHGDTVGSAPLVGGIGKEGWLDLFWEDGSDFVWKPEIVAQLYGMDQRELSEWFATHLSKYCGNEYRKGYKALVGKYEVVL